MPHDVFISHSSEDKVIADAVTAGLEKENVRCWIAPRDVLPGTNYGESIVNAIEGSGVVVLIYSAAANASNAVMREIERAMTFGKPIIPVRLEDVPIAKAMDFYLASCHWLDAVTPPMQQHIGRLAAAVRGLVSGDLNVKTLPATKTLQRTRSRVVSLVILLSLAVAGVVVTPKINSWLRQAKASGKGTGVERSVSMDLSVINSNEQPIAEFFDSTTPAVVRYRMTRADGGTDIKPVADYLTSYLAGGPVTTLRATITPRSYFIASTPQLDFKLLNDTDKTVYFVRLILHVDESQRLDDPVLVLADDAPRRNTLRLVNEGWARVQGATLRYRVDKIGAAGASEEYPLTRAIDGFDDSTDFEIDPTTLASETSAHFQGELSYLWRQGSGRVAERRLKFDSEIPLKPLNNRKPPKITPEMPNATPVYQCQLRLTGAEYEAAVELSQYLKPGEPDRFQVAIRAPESSRHKFVIELVYNDGIEKSIRSGPIALEYFSNRGGVRANERAGD